MKKVKEILKDHKINDGNLEAEIKDYGKDKFDEGYHFAQKNLAAILVELTGTAHCGTGAVAYASTGFCSLRLEAVIKKDSVLRVFKKHGIELLPKNDDQ